LKKLRFHGSAFISTRVVYQQGLFWLLTGRLATGKKSWLSLFLCLVSKHYLLGLCV